MDRKYDLFFKKTPFAAVLLKGIMDEGLLKEIDILEWNQSGIDKFDFSIEKTEVDFSYYFDIYQNKDSENFMEIFMETIKTHREQIGKLSRIANNEQVYYYLIPLEEDYVACVFSDAFFKSDEEREADEFVKRNLEMLCIWDIYGKFVKVNKRFKEVTGYTKDELVGKEFFSFIHRGDEDSSRDVIVRTYDSDKIRVFKNRFLCKDNTIKHFEWYTQETTKHYIFASVRDITLQVKLEERLKKIASKDELTNLYNRHYLETILEDLVNDSEHNQNNLVLAMLDIDHFKVVNDTWGHPIGDVILKQIVFSAGTQLDESDIFIRFGGEEFLIVFQNKKVEDVVEQCERIRMAIEKEKHPVVGKMTVSIGVAVRCEHESFASWYNRVDYAMYEAKSNGRNNVVVADTCSIDDTSNLHLLWDETMKSNDSEIDAQHFELFEMAHYFMKITGEGIEKDEINNFIDLLMGLLKEHFAFEETVLRRIGYTDYKEHMELHKKLYLKAELLKEKYDRGEYKWYVFRDFLVNEVIIGHITQYDRKFFSCLHESD